jgi:hypothetical protein
MWEAFHGRSASYTAALEAGAADALSQALGRNVWRGAPPPAGAAEALTRLALTQRAHLAGQDLAALEAGRATFLPADEAVR